MSVGSECLQTVARWRESFDFMVSPSLGGVRTAVVITLVRAEEKMQLVRCNLDRSSKRADWIGKRYRLVQQSILLFTPALRKQSFFFVFFFLQRLFNIGKGEDQTRQTPKTANQPAKKTDNRFMPPNRQEFPEPGEARGSLECSGEVHASLQFKDYFSKYCLLYVVSRWKCTRGFVSCSSGRFWIHNYM